MMLYPYVMMLFDDTMIILRVFICHDAVCDDI